MGTHVKGKDPPRTRRAERARLTRDRILRAATDLFLDLGYAAATIESIAARADVAVETVYSRFGNKARLVEAILEPAIVGADDGRDIFDQPEIAEIRQCRDQRVQVRLLSRFSRGILERTYTAHRILQTAAASDPNAAELQRRDTKRRSDGQRMYIEMLVANGPLRNGVSVGHAADTYSALSNPSTYAFLTRDQGWSADQFEEWLDDSLSQLLLP
ncbi:MAG: TetR/AcrR family transcriptional regulator [Actinomycetota bacterium]|nr:TetR/AcrR family transcriptional regulator [Actinomycetota bacterium]